METPAEKLDQRMTLSDGRQLGFAEYGDPAGRPLFYAHGWPSSRLEPRLLHPLCAELGLRLIAPDRPGYGLSEFQPARKIVDWPQDLAELANALGASRFAVLGVSGGGPYALACAAMTPARLTAVLLVCSLGPPDLPENVRGMIVLYRWLLGFARQAPRLAEKMACGCLRLFWGRGHNPIPASIEQRLPEHDRLALGRPDLRQALIASATEALRGGVRGAAADGLLLARPWGFRLEEILTPIRLWHGQADVLTPVAMGRSLARLLPNCEARFYADEGHFSLPYDHAREILMTAGGS